MDDDEKATETHLSLTLFTHCVLLHHIQVTPVHPREKKEQGGKNNAVILF